MGTVSYLCEYTRTALVRSRPAMCLSILMNTCSSFFLLLRALIYCLITSLTKCVFSPIRLDQSTRPRLSIQSPTFSSLIGKLVDLDFQSIKSNCIPIHTHTHTHTHSFRLLSRATAFTYNSDTLYNKVTNVSLQIS